jgi:cold shock CspA family protein/uncharacterized membrane protein
MPTGIVKWYSDGKGYGFLTPDDGSQDVFVHHSAIRGDSKDLREGEKVTYESEKGPKGPAASFVIMESARSFSPSADPSSSSSSDRPSSEPNDSSELLARVTRGAEQAIHRAEEEARSLRNRHTGTTHLLLGLIGAQDEPAGQALARLDVTTERVRDALLVVDRPGVGSPSGKIPLTPNAEAAVEAAIRESESMGATEVGTEHLLIAVTKTPRGLVGPTLKAIDCSQQQIQEALFEILDSRAEGVEAVPTHQDRPATTDRLGRWRLAEVIAERIRRARDEDTETAVATRSERKEKLRRDRRAAAKTGGFLVHIHAPWGAGKSSLLNFLASDLRNRGPEPAARPNLSQWIVADFSAWKHQRLVPPWWWLLASMRKSCAEELWQIDRRRWFVFCLRDIGWRLWNARAMVFWLTLLCAMLFAAWQLEWLGLAHKSLTTVEAIIATCISAIALITTLVGIAKGATRWIAIGSAEGAARFLKRAHDPLEVYRHRFQNLVKASGRPIAIFIDDLDRCKSEYIVELLEGIQTLFMEEPVTYVVAADRAWLCQSFASIYAAFETTTDDLGRSLGFHFLEKTFQISLRIPPMSDEGRDSYWAELMNGLPSKEADDERGNDDLIAAAFADSNTQAEVEDSARRLTDPWNRDEVLAAAVRRLNAPRIEGQTKSLLHRFAPLVETNPRSMKRVMNAYGVERDRLLRDGYLLTQTERKQLALLTIVHLRWPELADHLERHPEDVNCCLGSSEAEDDHRFAQLFEDPQLHRVFRGEGVDVALDPRAFRQFPAHPPELSD